MIYQKFDDHAKATGEYLTDEFKAALEKEYYTWDNPKKDRLWAIAYELGHSAGFSEIESYYSDLVDLVR